jgi:transposase
MNQAERDRLVTLSKAKKRLITRAEAATELGVSVRHVKRLLKALKERGDAAVIHGLRGRPSPRRLPETTKQEAIRILSDPLYAGFGPTLAAEYLDAKHEVKVSKETLRHWMIEPSCGGGASASLNRCMCGRLAVRVVANWCSGTHPITIGWKAAVRGCI